MKHRLLLLNAVLGLAVIYAAFRLEAEWTTFEFTHTVDAIQPEADPEVRTVPVAPPTPDVALDWTDTVRQNPFSFDRSDIPVLTIDRVEDPIELVAASAETPFLFGTASLGENQVAILAPRGGDRARPVRVGERVDGWELVEIGSKSVVVAANGASETVSMNDWTQAIERDRSRTGGGAEPSARAAPVVAGVPSQPAPQPAATTGTPAGRTPPPAPAGPQTPANPPGTRVLRTPWGEVVIEERP